MAEQKKGNGAKAKPAAKKGTAAKAAPKKSSAKPAAKKETTAMSVPSERFGDSIVDEVILILVIVVAIVVEVSLVTSKMGIVGSILSGFFKGLLGFGGILLPVLVVVYCIWLLVSKERKWPVVRALGGLLFLLSVSAAAQLINPADMPASYGFMQKAAVFYSKGAVSNGGLLGGALGSGLYNALDTLGSVLVLLALLIISVIMSTGKSAFHALADYSAHRKAKQKIKNEKIKSRAEQIRQKELEEAEKERRRRERTVKKGSYNIELDDKGSGKKDVPVIEETVFKKKEPVKLKKATPIFDFTLEPEDEATDIIPPQDIENNHSGEPAENEDDIFGQIFHDEEAGFEEDIPVAVITDIADDLGQEEQPEDEEPKEAQEDMEPQPDDVIPRPVEEAEEEIPYVFPPVSLLGMDPGTGASGSKAEMLANARKLETTLKSFGVDAKVIQINRGPTVTRYELSPSQGVKVSKIVNLADDIALNLAASGIRIEAPIPGKAAVGIEVPNQETQSVYLRTVIESETFKKHPSKLAFALGEDIAGNPVITDIAKMPHLLIAGATGSGKSVCINTLITSILYKADPSEVKLLLVDPKVVELSVYNGIPHLLIPVVTDPKKASAALNWAVREMLQRYNDFAAFGVRDIKGFNDMKDKEGDAKGKMPQIVIIIDELADLMMAAPKEVEDSICRLAQMARAAGMHLIIATQRPSVDVITGVIKANIPSRLAFAVSSGIDSRTILDMVGAEKLLGKGDMLFYPAGQSKPARLQGAFVTDKEVEEIVAFLRKTGRKNYSQETIDKITAVVKDDIGGGEESDEFFDQAVELIMEKEKASVSMLQRQFRIGYNRAARLMEELEKRGIVGPEDGSKPRKVLITRAQWEAASEPVEEEID